MLPLAEPPNAEAPSNFFNSAFMEIEDYLDFVGDSKGGQDLSRSPRLTPALSPLATPPLKSNYRSNLGTWGGGGGENMRDSHGSGGFYPSTYIPTLAGLNTTDTAIEDLVNIATAPLQTTSSFMGQPSPPESSGSPLDSLISRNANSDTAPRTVHGQATPPDDFTKSPTLQASRHLPTALVLPMRLISPEGSPPRNTSPRHRGLSISESAKPISTSGARGGGTKRRRSATGQSSSGRKPRKAALSADEDPETQDAKRRRHLERNRVAASRCRQKKKAWMQELELEARDVQNTSKQLKGCVAVLKEEVLRLKNELLKHNTCECIPIRRYLSGEAMRLADDVLGKPETQQSCACAPMSSSSVTSEEHQDDSSAALRSDEFDLDFGDDAEATAMG